MRCASTASIAITLLGRSAFEVNAVIARRYRVTVAEYLAPRETHWTATRSNHSASRDALGRIGVRPSISGAQSSRLSLQLTRRIPPAISQKTTSQPSSVKQDKEHAGYDRLAIQ
jgi:hypothetical protein